MENSGNVTCYGDVCTEGSFCDNLSQFCFQCAQWLQTCFTDNHIPRCTRICKEHIDDHVTTFTPTLAPSMELKSENSVTLLVLFSVVAFSCLTSTILIIACLFKTFDKCKNTVPTKALVNNICRISNTILRRKRNNQTFVKQRALDKGQGVNFPVDLSLTSLLNETETISPRNVTPPMTDQEPFSLIQPQTSMTLSENISCGPSAHTRTPNTNSAIKDERDCYQIPKPVKEVGDDGGSVKVYGHVLEPRETV